MHDSATPMRTCSGEETMSSRRPATYTPASLVSCTWYRGAGRGNAEFLLPPLPGMRRAHHKQCCYRPGAVAHMVQIRKRQRNRALCGPVPHLQLLVLRSQQVIDVLVVQLQGGEGSGAG